MTKSSLGVNRARRRPVEVNDDEDDDDQDLLRWTLTGVVGADETNTKLIEEKRTMYHSLGTLRLVPDTGVCSWPSGGKRRFSLLTGSPDGVDVNEDTLAK